MNLSTTLTRSLPVESATLVWFETTSSALRGEISKLEISLTVDNCHRNLLETPYQASEESGTRHQMPDLNPKLGDFQKVYSARSSSVTEPPGQSHSHLLLHTAESESAISDHKDSAPVSCKSGVAKLGDFRRLQIPCQNAIYTPKNGISQLGSQHRTTQLSPGPYGGGVGDHSLRCQIKDDDITFALPQRTQSSFPVSHDDQGSLSAAHEGDQHVSEAAATIHKERSHNGLQLQQGLNDTSEANFEPHPQKSLEQNRELIHSNPLGEEAESFRSPVLSESVKNTPTPNVAKILSYKLGKKDLTPVLGAKPSLDQQHRSLLLKLVPLRAGDARLAMQDDKVARNGVHVFLDMSNINISFHNALRAKFSIHEHARFVPLPQLNLQFLTEILVRGRKVVALNAGCSVPPYRQEPRYVHDLQELGYRVDLRERTRAVEHARSGFRGDKAVEPSSSDEIASSSRAVRYIEELVDETLQTRIAESVMEFFEDQGTLVIATGDAQPAKYSDGFFVYAERALRMGWNVEVVSWKISLSSHWNKPGWAEHWGGRFRVVELDDYIDLLLV